VKEIDKKIKTNYTKLSLHTDPSVAITIKIKSHPKWVAY
jgi:hypothetical protein